MVTFLNRDGGDMVLPPLGNLPDAKHYSVEGRRYAFPMKYACFCPFLLFVVCKWSIDSNTICPERRTYIIDIAYLYH